MKKYSMYHQIYSVIRQIPVGRVATYGQIARLAGLPGHARMTGYALHSLPEGRDVPWHRVINAKGETSRMPDPDSSYIQRWLLEAEGVVFNGKSKVDLTVYQWRPDVNDFNI